MKKGLVCLLVILSFSLASVAPCYFSDSPDCACFTNTATWNPSGTWIQDIALDTVGTIVSCVPDGGKPFYQMRLGLNSASSATSVASILEVLSGIGINIYDREAWCSEAISYWHREAGIPYSGGYRRSDWHLDWQLTHTNAIRAFYKVEEILSTFSFLGGRGRWIEWTDLDYSDFRPGINAPAPGSYVLIRRYDDSAATWDGRSHSMMINEMTIHQNGFGDVIEVEVSLVEGNASSPAQVRASSKISDLISYTPGGTEWLSSNRKILGFGVDLDEHGLPIYDPDRLHYEKDLFVAATLFKPFPTEDPLWSRFYAPLVRELVDYAMKTMGGPRITGPFTVIGEGGIPDGRTVSWTFGPTVNSGYPNGVEIGIDLLQNHPLQIKGIVLAWKGSIPTGYAVRYAANGDTYQEATVPVMQSVALTSQQADNVMVPIAFGKESALVRTVQLIFPPGSIAGESELTEMRFIYDWGPSDEAEFNPIIEGGSMSGPLSVSVSASASAVAAATHSHVLTLSWKISGGTAPVQLAVKITGPDGVTVNQSDDMLEGERRFELAYPKGGTVTVSVEVTDAAGSSARGTASVNLSP